MQSKKKFKIGLALGSGGVKGLAHIGIIKICYHFAQNCSRNGDVVIKPKMKEIGLVGWNKFFNEQGVKEIINAGEEAAIKSIVQIKNLIKEKEVKIC